MWDTDGVVESSWRRVLAYAGVVLLALPTMAGSCHGEAFHGAKVVDGGTLVGPVEEPVQILVRVRADAYALGHGESPPSVCLVLGPQADTTAVDGTVASCDLLPEASTVLHQDDGFTFSNDWQYSSDDRSYYAEGVFSVPPGEVPEGGTPWAVLLEWAGDTEEATIDVVETIVVEAMQGSEVISGESTVLPGETENGMFRVTTDAGAATPAFGGTAVLIEIAEVECETCRPRMAIGITEPFHSRGAALLNLNEFAYVDGFDCADDTCTADVPVAWTHSTNRNEPIRFSWTVELRWLLPKGHVDPVLESLEWVSHREPVNGLQCALQYGDGEPVMTNLGYATPCDFLDPTGTTQLKACLRSTFPIGSTADASSGTVTASYRDSQSDVENEYAIDDLPDDGILLSGESTDSGHPHYSITCWVHED